MKRAIKIAAVLFALLLLLIVALAVLACYLITPERIKTVVVPKLEAALNRQIRLEDVEISIFTGIRLNNLTVFEPDGGEPFVAADAVVLRYQLLPLLFKRIVVDEVRFVAPAIRIERRPDGSFNFSDLLPGEEAPANAASGEKRGKIDLLVSHVEVSDGRLLFIDRAVAAGNPFRQELTTLNLSVRDLSPGREFPFTFAARVNAGTINGEGALNPLTAAGRIALTVAELDLVPFAPYYREHLPAQVNALRLQAKLEAQGNRQEVQSRGQVAFAPIDLLLIRPGKEPLPLRDLTLKLEYAASVELAAAAIEIEEATAAVNGIQMQVAGRVVDYATAPKVNLRLVVPAVDVQTALRQLPAGLVAPVADLQPAGEVGAEFHLAGAASEPKRLLQKGEIRLSGLSVLVDGARPSVAGTLNVAGDTLAGENLQLQLGENRAVVDLQVANLFGDVPRVRSSLRAERFALDPLLQGSAAPAAAKAPPADGKDPFPLSLPVAADGNLAIGETVYQGLSIRDFGMRYRLQDNRLTVENLEGKVADGTFAISGNADLGRRAPPFSAKIALRGIQAAPLLQAFYPQLAGSVFGTLNLQSELSGQGSEAAAIKRTLSGEGTLQLADGRIVGTRLLQGLADFLALPELREVRFNRSKGSFTIRRGRLSVDSDIDGGTVRLHPEGTVALETLAVDLALNLQLAPNLVARLGSGRAATFLTDARGWAKIPVRVGGTLTSPRFSLDTAAVGERLREKTGEEIRRRLRKELERRLPAGNGEAAPPQQPQPPQVPPGTPPAGETGEELRRRLRQELDRRFPGGSGASRENGGNGAEEMLRALFAR